MKNNAFNTGEAITLMLEQYGTAVKKAKRIKKSKKVKLSKDKDKKTVK